MVDETGRRLARGSAGGANQNSSAAPAHALTEAMHAALATLAPELRSRVEQVVVGIAGGGSAGRESATATATEACRAAGLEHARLGIESDIEIAYAAGSSVPSGTVLIAGTGAVAAAVERFTVVRRSDGLGYLLGDNGSAVWLGIEAVRAVAAAEEGRGPATALSTEVMSRVRADDPGLPAEPTQALVSAVYGAPPAALGRFAPLVERAAAAGDDVARRIVEGAVSALVATVAGVRDAGATSLPLVVAGAVATSDGVLGATVRARLQERFGVTPVCAPDGVVGAAFLALRRLPGVTPEALNRLRAG